MFYSANNSELLGAFLSAIISAFLFGLFPYYLQHLHPITGDDIFSQRVIWSCVCSTCIVLLLKRQGKLIKIFLEPKTCILMILATALVGVQWWLFVWAPVNGHAIDLAMGYFLLPLAMVMVGWLWLNEPLRLWQRIAASIAFLGVAIEWFTIGQFSWVTFLVMLGYPPYFLIKKKLKVDSLVGFAFENIILFPIVFFSAYSLFSNYSLAIDPVLASLPLFGIICTLAMVLYITGARGLPVSMFGILIYVEPVVLFMVAVVFLKEPLLLSQWVTHSVIFLAVLISIVDSFKQIQAGEVVHSS